MSKDLEKEYLEDLDHYDEGMGIHSTSYAKCKERLIRLAKIDNSNPSEALECLEEIGKTLMFFNKNTLESKPLKEVMSTYYNIIKQALIKAQEQEVDIIHYKGTVENLRRDNALLKDIKNEQEKVLDIIKNKNVNVAQFKFWLKENFVTTYERYKYDSDQEGWYLHLEDGRGVIDYLTQEEFDLLKRYCDVWTN